MPLRDAKLLHSLKCLMVHRWQPTPDGQPCALAAYPAHDIITALESDAVDVSAFLGSSGSGAGGADAFGGGGSGSAAGGGLLAPSLMPFLPPSGAVVSGGAAPMLHTESAFGAASQIPIGAELRRGSSAADDALLSPPPTSHTTITTAFPHVLLPTPGGSRFSAQMKGGDTAAAAAASEGAPLALPQAAVLHSSGDSAAAAADASGGDGTATATVASAATGAAAVPLQFQPSPSSAAAAAGGTAATAVTAAMPRIDSWSARLEALCRFDSASLDQAFGALSAAPNYAAAVSCGSGDLMMATPAAGADVCVNGGSAIKMSPSDGSLQQLQLAPPPTGDGGSGSGGGTGAASDAA